MDFKLQHDRQQRDISNPAAAARESTIKRIMLSYGYDH